MFDGRCYTFLFIARRYDNAKTVEFRAGGLGWHERFEIKAISESNPSVFLSSKKTPVGRRSCAIREFMWISTDAAERILPRSGNLCGYQRTRRSASYRDPGIYVDING